MPGSKSSRTAAPSGAAKDKRVGKQPSKPKTPRKPPKPPGSPPLDDQFFAEPPIVVTSGSVMIDVDKTIFPPEPGDPNKHKNARRKLTSIEIQDLADPPKTLMTIDLRALSKGKCKILIKYEK
jgi:hypothetical protein